MSKYLTYDQRLEIQAGLKESLSFGAIAKKINKDRTTVAKEIKRNLIIKKTGYSVWPYNACKHRKNCNKSKVCDECIDKNHTIVNDICMNPIDVLLR